MLAKVTVLNENFLMIINNYYDVMGINFSLSSLLDY